MIRSRVATLLSLAIVALAAIVLAGCSKKITSMIVPNMKPTVRLTSAPFDTTGRYFYSYRLNWVGDDPDGRVDHFVYWVDGGSTIPVTATTKNEQIIPFPATRPDTTAAGGQSRASDFHTFSIVAVDNNGDSSDVVNRSFFSYTVAPTATITSPSPSHLSVAYVTPALHITWTGTDPDGQRSTKPVKYKFKLFATGGEFPIDVAVANPDSLRRFYAPKFAGWDSTSTDTTEVQYTNLTPNADYLFVLVSFDEAGAYSPVFSLDVNMLQIRTTFAASNGPVITIFNEFFTYKFGGGYNLDPRFEAPLEVPVNLAITFNWFATPPPNGAAIQSYRWRLGGDVFDETPRTNELTDVSHWSAPSLNVTSAVVGPFPRDTLLRFYVEATDNNALRSLGTVRFTVVRPTFANPLAIIDDTRLLGDQVTLGVYKVPTGPWPTAAELDTFMYARGNVPWVGYPSGTMSEPGLFSGYRYDTLTTLTGRIDQTFSLSVIGRYQNVMWMVDSKSSQIETSPGKLYTSLRYMSSPNHANTLSTYIKEGGRAWLSGGGAAYATLIPWSARNHLPGVWSEALLELIPGRMMYDLIHWRNQVASGGSTPTFTKSPRAVGGWTGQGRDLLLNAPDYSSLPLTLRKKTAGIDAFPPNRVGQSQSGFYQSATNVEYLPAENFIIEDLDPSVLNVNNQSTLDTLYNVATFNGDLPKPTMTYYHGLENGEVVFSGFPIWWLSRPDARAVVDFVMQKIFKQPMPSLMYSRNAPALKSNSTSGARSVPATPVFNPGSSGALNGVLRNSAVTSGAVGSVRKPRE